MSRADQVILHEGPGFRRALFLRDGACLELWVEAADDPALAGGVALVIARRFGAASIATLPTLAVAALGAGSTREGYVRDARPRDGERIVVQVARDAGAGKRPVLRTRVEIAGAHTRLTPSRPEVGLSAAVTGKARRSAIRQAIAAALPDGWGVAVEASAGDCDPEDLAAEIRGLVTAWRKAEERAAGAQLPVWLVQPPSFEHRVRRAAPNADLVLDDDGVAFDEAGGPEAVERALARRVAIPDLGEVVVDTVEAATLIDVNLVASPRGVQLVRANAAIGREVAALARLRGLRGTLLIDFPRMSGRGDRHSVRQEIETAVQEDPADWQILGWTPGGMLECLRSADNRSVADVMLTPAGGQSLSARARAWLALQQLRREAGSIARPRLRVSADVGGWLSGPGAGIVAAERRRLGALTIVADPDLGPDDLRIDSEV